MVSIVDPILDGIETVLAWISSGTKATIDANCNIQTADGPHTLVTNDGSLFSVLQVDGVSSLVGNEEFNAIHDSLKQAFSPFMSVNGHSLQVVFSYSRERVVKKIEDIFAESLQTAEELKLDLNDLVEERVQQMSNYCAVEKVFIVIWTKVSSLTRDQRKKAMSEKAKIIKSKNMPVFRYTQNIIAAIPDLRDSHESNVRSVINTASGQGLIINLLESHDALKAIRMEIDRTFTDKSWEAVLPGDMIRPKIAKSFSGDIADLLWPAISKQIFPRDAYNTSFDTAQIGDFIYGCVFIDLFPREVQTFHRLMSRTLDTAIPWRISFLLESGGLQTLSMKKALSTVLAFSSEQNRLIADGIDLLHYIDLNTDDNIVKLRVAACTWVHEDNIKQLKVNVSLLARAIQGWGPCDITQICGDPFEGVLTTLPAVTGDSVATATIASLSDAIGMLPLFRPTSPWSKGALLFRSPDGKLWPYQPGSPLQTTCIDLIYARPGSGKSVLSNAMNLALCLMGGLKRLPRVSIIDIGPSSSGLISLLQEALPEENRNLAAYHRLQMTEEYSINPFDTQLGSRVPTPAERSFLVNFITLIATPVGEENPYDGLSDMAGLVIDEAYKALSDKNNPNVYTSKANEIIDAILKDISFVADTKTSWWEVTDAIFMAGFVNEALLAQRHAMPLLSDLASIARTTAVEDLFGKITTPTEETLITAFTRMISSAIREYPILSRTTQFDIGAARVVSLDLDEVAKAGGVAADRQTAIMYMLARYVITKDFYINPEVLNIFPKSYRGYHEKKISQSQEDPKRLVMDEFHRTSKSKSIRNQVIQDMREGRKWRVQVALLSQSLSDFDSNMIDFATSIFVLDAGPEQAIQETKKVFGLNATAEQALRGYVRSPGEGGATMLAQFATKQGTTTQLITLTLGPIELWAFSTTTEDYMLRNQLYKRIGPKEARKLLARLFPSGSAAKFLLRRSQMIKDKGDTIDEENKKSLVNNLADEIVDNYRKDPSFQKIVA